MAKPEIARLPDPVRVDAAQVLAAYAKGECELICVLGPTASGKTRYAVALAREIDALIGLGALEGCPSGMTGILRGAKGCEIISADSRQVFRRMDIGTGKDLAEYGEIPCHLIDILEPGDEYNVFRFQQDFRAAYDDIRRRDAIPILCGGTGLYINAVTSGYAWDGEKHPLSEGRPADRLKTFFIGTLVSREVRVERIDRRLDQRLKEGMVEEIRGLLDSGVSAGKLISYGLEYKYVTQYVLGELTFDEMREKLAIAIHQFAKRQMTWFRGMERAGAEIHWTEV